MKKLLITGASGIVGRALAKACSSRFDVVGTYYKHNFQPDFLKLKALDLNDAAGIENCLDTIQPAIVVHTAGLTEIPYCENNRQEAEAVNYRATAQLAAFCTQRGIRLVYISSDMVFDGIRGNYNENDIPSPLNQYGKSKFAGEEAVKSICQNYVIARLNLIYGRAESSKKTFSDRILIANWAQRPFKVYAGHVRSPLSLDTAVRAIRELAEGDFGGMYHLAGAETVDRWDLAVKTAAYLKIDPACIEKTDPPAELSELYPVNTSYDISKAKTDLKTEFLGVDDGLKLEYGKYLE